MAIVDKQKTTEDFWKFYEFLKPSVGYYDAYRLRLSVAILRCQ